MRVVTNRSGTLRTLDEYPQGYLKEGTALKLHVVLWYDAPLRPCLSVHVLTYSASCGQYFDLASVEDDGSLLYKLHREYIIQFDAIVAHGRLLVPDLRYPRAPMMRLLCDTELLRQDEADDVADSRRQSFLAGLPEYLKVCLAALDEFCFTV